jgi:hypothetical protein
MGHRIFGLVAVAGVLGGCAPDDAPAPGLNDPTTAHAVAVESLPDLVVDTERLAKSWVIYAQSFPAASCSVRENGMTPGDHRVLRFTVSTPNIGLGDVYVGDPRTHLAANDGLFEYAACHAHLHFRHYANYELIDPATGRVLVAAKRGFCMLDVEKYRAPDAPKGGRSRYRSCGTLTTPGDQGISPGWADVYDKRLDGQFFVLDEPTGTIPPGEYVIRITVNPPFICGPEDSLRPRDDIGLCHNFAEANYDNNAGEALVRIPATIGARGFGPGSGAPAPVPGQTQKEVAP